MLGTSVMKELEYFKTRKTLVHVALVILISNISNWPLIFKFVQRMKSKDARSILQRFEIQILR